MITLVVKKTIKASPARIFAAWTEPAQLLQWWGPRPVTCSSAEVDLRVGGAYRIGNRLPDGSEIVIAGRFEVVEPPSRLVYTWHVEGKAEPSRVTVRFEPRGDATQVVIVHEQVDSEATRADHEQGWQGCLDGLAALFD